MPASSRTSPRQSVIHVTTVNYPESDGKPMGETDLHRDVMVRNIELLKSYYRGRKVYVSGDLLVYYEEGNPKKFVVPDAFVAKGLEPGRRRIYKIWREGKAPDVVLETTSRKTRRKDAIDKPQLYARLGVREYFLFDPEDDYLKPPLQGYRLSGSEFHRIEPDETGALVSQELELKLTVEQGELEFYRLDTGERLLTADERVANAEAAQHTEAAARQVEAAARHAEAAARQAAEAEVEQLLQELAHRPP